MTSAITNLCSCSCPSSSEKPLRRIAVIGAGPIGVSTAKCLLGEEYFDKIDVYEQQVSFGGAWIWSQPQPDDQAPVPQTNPLGELDRVTLEKRGGETKPVVATPMYDRLETNIPHLLMTFSDQKFSSNDSLFPSRTSVLRYIEEYSQDIKHLVKFEHQVTHVQLDQTAHGSDLWKVTYKELKTGKKHTEQYDAVAVANGHFSHVSIPDTPGIREWNEAYPGSICHSKYYRKAEDYAGKKVVVVGNASSGIDIGSQIAGTCQKPLIMSARSEPLFRMPDYAEHINVSGLVEFINPKFGQRAVRFADGRMEENIDVVLFCTGYFLSFPFFEAKLQNSIINSGYMAHGVFKYIFWIPHNTLAFLGLPNKVLPMPLGEAQAAVVARVWSGRLSMPRRLEMQIWEHQRWLEVAEMLKNKGKPCEAHDIEKAFLAMGPGQDMEYHDELVEWASKASPGPGRDLPRKWSAKEKWIRSQMAPLKKAYAELGNGKYNVRSIEELGINYEQAKERSGQGIDQARIHAGSQTLEEEG